MKKRRGPGRPPGKTWRGSAREKYWRKREAREQFRSNPPPGVMSTAEIRYWLGVLLTKYGWGDAGLARTLGSRSGMLAKALGKSWIVRTEQVRYSRILPRIISGELVFQPEIRVLQGCRVADNPVPLPQPARFVYDTRRNKIARVAPRAPGTAAVPSFAGAIKNAGRWRESTFPPEERRERDA